MRQVKFRVDGVDGDFLCDADELTNYHTIKQILRSGTNPLGLLEAVERVFMGKDEEYVDRVGGVGEMRRLVDAAMEAVNAKNSSASSRASKSTGTK